jgi:hypothetical protein
MLRFVFGTRQSWLEGILIPQTASTAVAMQLFRVHCFYGQAGKKFPTHSASF